MSFSFKPRVCERCVDAPHSGQSLLDNESLREMCVSKRTKPRRLDPSGLSNLRAQCLCSAASNYEEGLTGGRPTEEVSPLPTAMPVATAAPTPSSANNP